MRNKPDKAVQYLIFILISFNARLTRMENCERKRIIEKYYKLFFRGDRRDRETSPDHFSAIVVFASPHLRCHYEAHYRVNIIEFKFKM